MIMAFSGMDKDERQASGTDFWKGVDGKKKVAFGLTLSAPHARKRVSGRGRL